MGKIEKAKADDLGVKVSGSARTGHKIELAQDMLDRAMDRFGPALALAWTGGKDSTLLLWLAREACMRSGRPLPEIITIDEGDPFPEMERFQAALTTAWVSSTARSSA